MLKEKQIPFDVTEIDLKNKPDWFLKISPYGKVPVIQDGDEVIYESAVINEYLEEVYPETPMLAGSAGERAHLRIWIDFCNTRLQPTLAQLIRCQPEDFEAKKQALEDALATLEDYLERKGMPDPFFTGAQFSLVDATYAPAFERFAVLPRLRGYEIPGRYPRVTQWMKTLAAHPSVQATSTPLEALLQNYMGMLPEQVRAQVA